ncbi:MAG: RNA 2',3'-cyclic phosphodiesterase [Pseudomonadota bacterium]
METTRLFLALWPEQRVREQLRQARDTWTWPGKASPVLAERLHLTLHFLGDLPSARLPALAAGLAVPFQPFELTLGTPVLWAHGVAVLEPDAIEEALLDLQAALGRALAGLGVAADPRPYRPHVALARRAASACVPPPGAPISWPVRGYALVQSKQGNYTVVRQYHC